MQATDYQPIGEPDTLTLGTGETITSQTYARYETHDGDEYVVATFERVHRADGTVQDVAHQTFDDEGTARLHALRLEALGYETPTSPDTQAGVDDPNPWWRSDT